MGMDELAEVLQSLKACITSRKGGVPLHELNSDYKELLGEDIPIHKFGHENLQTFLRCVPGVFVDQAAGTVRTEPTTNTQHLHDLISKQKDNAKKSKNRYKPYNPHLAYNRQNYNKQRYQPRPYNHKPDKWSRSYTNCQSHYNQPNRNYINRQPDNRQPNQSYINRQQNNNQPNRTNVYGQPHNSQPNQSYTNRQLNNNQPNRTNVNWQPRNSQPNQSYINRQLNNNQPNRTNVNWQPHNSQPNQSYINRQLNNNQPNRTNVNWQPHNSQPKQSYTNRQPHNNMPNENYINGLPNNHPSVNNYYNMQDYYSWENYGIGTYISVLEAFISGMDTFYQTNHINDHGINNYTYGDANYYTGYPNYLHWISTILSCIQSEAAKI